MGRSGAIAVGFVIVACALMQACAKKHSPQDSTETGNPPVIDAERVALVVQGDEVHVIGSKGAVTPGGVTIHVTNLVSDKSASRAAAKDGSFEVKAPGGVNDAYEVHATRGGAQSKAVIVVQSEAILGKGDAGAPSCEQWVQLASDQQEAVIAEADTSCARDSDCLLAQRLDFCVAACDAVWVSQAGIHQIGAVVSAIHDGICAEYERAGCDPGVVGCSVPHGGAVCDRGHCVTPDSGPGAGVSDAGSDAGALTCEQRLDQADALLVQAEDAADRTCSSDNDCVVGPFDTECSQGCPGVIVSAKGRMQLQDAIASINAGVCAGYTDDGCSLPILDCGGAGTPVCKQGRCQADFTCEQRSNDAAAQLRNAVALADNTCSTNVDCVYAPVGVDCFAGCSSPAISVTGEAQLQGAIGAINAGICAGFMGDGCRVILPPCPAPPDMPTCNQGRCAPGPSCDDRVAAAQARLDQVAAIADKACTKDADCDYSTAAVGCSLPCGGGAILSAKGRSQYDAAVAEFNASVCKNFLADGCPMSGTICTAPPTPICKDGQCAGASAP